MTKTLSLLLGLVIFTSFSSVEKGKYKVFFVQDSLRKEVTAGDEVIELRKAPFKIEVHLYNREGVFVSIASEPTYYNVPENSAFIDPQLVGPMCQAEDNHNEDKDIIVDNESFCYWYYDKESPLWRFDKEIQDKGDHIAATMTVDNIYYPETKSLVPLSDFSTPLYFIFFHKEVNKKGVSSKITEQKKVRIVFK